MAIKQQFNVGQTVLITNSRQKGTVMSERDKKNRYQVLVGSMTMRVDETALESLESKGKVKKSRPRSPDSHSRKSKDFLSIDLHGKTVAECEALLEEFLNTALLENCDSIEIIHGRGSGALRRAVEAFLSRSRQVAHFSLKSGNDGITVAYI